MSEQYIFPEVKTDSRIPQDCIGIEQGEYIHVFKLDLISESVREVFLLPTKPAESAPAREWTAEERELIERANAITTECCHCGQCDQPKANGWTGKPCFKCDGTGIDDPEYDTAPCRACGGTGDEYVSAPAPREEDAPDEARDFKLIETGFSYWATTLNRVAARLALGRVKQKLAAERERASEAETEIRRLDLVVQDYMARAEKAEAESAEWRTTAETVGSKRAELADKLETAEAEAKALREALEYMLAVFGPMVYGSSDPGLDRRIAARDKARAALREATPGHDSLHAGEG